MRGDAGRSSAVTRWRRGGASYGASVEGEPPRPDEGSSERSVRRNAISHAPRSAANQKIRFRSRWYSFVSVYV
eukprot:scaffold38126_cov48-Phaeocystis_antarctica.AAC.3